MAVRSCAPASGSSWPRRRRFKTVRLLMCQNPSEFVRFFLYFLWLKWFKLKAFCKLQGVLFLLLANCCWFSMRLGWGHARPGSEHNTFGISIEIALLFSRCFHLPEVPCLWSFRRRHVARFVLLCRCVWCTSQGNCRPTLANGSDMTWYDRCQPVSFLCLLKDDMFHFDICKEILKALWYKWYKSQTAHLLFLNVAKED